jgi:hypothetical protein
MPDYSWVCHSCKTSNSAGLEVCRECGFPAEATGAEIEEAITGVKRQPLPSRKELQRERRAEMAALPLWKKPIAYLIRAAQFFGSLIFLWGIFDLSGSQVFWGLAIALATEALFNLLKGKAVPSQAPQP